MPKKIKIIGLPVIMVLLLSGCNVPFTNKVIYLPMIEKKPDEVLALMIDKMQGVKAGSHNSEADISVSIAPDKLGAKTQDSINRKAEYLFSGAPVVLGVDMETLDVPALPSFIGRKDLLGSDTVDFNIKVNTAGRYDDSDENNKKSESRNDITVLSGGVKVDLVLDSIAVNKDNYIKIGRTPAVSNTYFSGLGDKWIMLNSDEIKSEQDMKIADLPGSHFFAEALEKKYNIFAGAKSLAKEKDLFSRTQRLQDQKINGRNSYRYLLNINKQKVLPLLDEAFPFDKASEKGLDGLRAENEHREKMQKILDGIGELNILVWIDKKNFHLHKYVINIDYNGIAFDGRPGAFSIKAKISSEFEFAEILPIEAPVNAFKFNEAFQNFVITPVKTVGMPARDRKRAADADNIVNFLRTYYNERGIYPNDLYYAFEEYFSDGENTVYPPVNPRPNDGDCDPDFNYRYLSLNSGTAYEFEFCLGGQSGENKAGINKVISDMIDLPSITTNIKYDMDRDGLSDYDEPKYNTDPRNPDTDFDGLWDYEEIAIYGTDPLNKDTDGDGYEDGQEVANWFDPLKKQTALEPFKTADGTIRKSFEKKYAGDAEAYMSKIHISNELIDFAAKELKLNINDFLSILKEANAPRGRRLEFINFTLAEKIDEDNYRYEFVEKYHPFANGYIPGSLKRSAYVKNVNGIWLFNILEDLKELKKQGTSWPIVLQIFAK
jgi:hypothetical protein